MLYVTKFGDKILVFQAFPKNPKRHRKLATLHTWVRKAVKGEWSVADENITAIKVDKPVNSAKAIISQKLHEQLSAEQKKSAELERQVRRLMQEHEILKKAMAYCLDVPK